MQAAGAEPTNGTVRGIAIAVATFACFIHAFSRRGGILLNNTLAIVKLLMLLLIIIAAIIVGARGFKTENVIGPNTSPDTAFKDAYTEPYGYASAFLAIIFSFSGFEQPNYVLGEISHPRRKFPIGMGFGVGLVVTLYMCVNICYVSQYFPFP
jgi:amino acid transporter